MAVVGRAIRWLIALALIAIAVLWPLVFTGSSSAGQVDDPVTFSEYRADFHVDGNGNLDATETITAEFPSGRHGLFRYWDIANPNSPRVRQKPEITSILMDGNPIDYQMLSESGGRFRVAKIGDPDRYLDWGTHIFEIRYTVPGVLDPGTPVPARNSPPPPVRAPTGNRRRCSSGTSSPRRGTTASIAPTSPSHCPPRSPVRSVRSVPGSAAPATT